jgi:hypothetical protein
MMSNIRRIEEHTIAELAQPEEFRKTVEAAKEHGMSKQTIFPWRAKRGNRRAPNTHGCANSICSYRKLTMPEKFERRKQSRVGYIERASFL